MSTSDADRTLQALANQLNDITEHARKHFPWFPASPATAKHKLTSLGGSPIEVTLTRERMELSWQPEGYSAPLKISHAQRFITFEAPAVREGRRELYEITVNAKAKSVQAWKRGESVCEPVAPSDEVIDELLESLPVLA